MNSRCKEGHLSSAWISKIFLTLLAFSLPLYAEKGLPNLSTRNDPSSSNFSFSADFLAWFASQEVVSIWADVITIGDNTSTWNAKGFDFNWDYGFRVGADYGFTHDGWDIAAYWTWFRTDATHTIPYTPNSTISPEFFAAFLSGNSPQSMSTHWSLLFNLIDLELGRSYWVSHFLALKPFVGIKGSWIHQAIDAKYSNLTINHAFTHTSALEHVKNNFWGVGPSGGVNTKWQIRQFGMHALDFFGDFSMASLWGSWNCSDFYINSNNISSSVNTPPDSLGALMFRGFWGFEWEVGTCNTNTRFAIKLGYEMQIWLNQLRIATFQLQRLHGDLTLQGATLNARLDF